MPLVDVNDINATDLIDEIDAILLDNQLYSFLEWKALLSPNAVGCTDIGLQRFLINRRWREILGCMGIDTIDARFCLVDQGYISDWLRLFKDGVIPCLLKSIQVKTP